MQNKYEILGAETIIFVKYKGQEMTTAIDTEELNKIKNIDVKWRANKSGNTYYAITLKFSKGVYKSYSLHRIIMDTPENMVVDHINHDGLNNKKVNLRNVTPYENSQNMLKPSNWINTKENACT